jgi:hypothetical protein
VPEGIVQARINPETGLRDSEGKVEYFYQEFLPAERERESESAPTLAAPGAPKPPEEVKGQLF